MTVFTIFLFIHSVSGALALITGTFVMFLNKFTPRHAQLGKLFAVSMLLSGISSFVLSSLHYNDFLFGVGVFTLYLIITGWNFLSLKNNEQSPRYRLCSLLLMSLISLFALFFMYRAISLFLQANYIGTLFLLFALGSFAMARQDYNTLKGKKTAKNDWMLLHLQRMVAAYIASLTAFLVVNAPQSMNFIAWLIPTAILTPIIIMWVKKYRVDL